MRRPAYLTGLFHWVNFGLWTVVLGVVMLLIWPFDPERRGMARAMRVLWGRGPYWTNPLWTVHPEGTPAGPGPYVVVSNHQSHTDIPNVLALIPPTRIVARDGIFRSIPLGPFLKLSRQVHQDRFEAEAADALRAGFSVLVFPEGSRSPDGEIHRFHNGAFEVARTMGVPVLPLVLDGSRALLAKGQAWPRNTRIRVRVALLPPVDPSAYDSTPALKHAVHDAMKAVLAGWRDGAEPRQSASM